MGIETLPDVEESTEPPICGYTESSTNSHATNSLSFELCDEKLKPSIDPEGQCTIDDRLKDAHLLEPAHIASFLHTNLQYVERIGET